VENMKKRELLTFTESLLFIIGAMLLLFNIATGKGIWFFIGLALAAIAVAVWLISFIAEKRNKTPDAVTAAHDKTAN
jgi:O-antigen/teichoic acid export membrane protein